MASNEANIHGMWLKDSLKCCAHGVFPSFRIYSPPATIRCWIHLLRYGAWLLVQFPSLGRTPSRWASVQLVLPSTAFLSFVMVLLRGLFDSLGEGGGGGRRCSQEAKKTDGRQGRPAGRYAEGKTPDSTQGQGDCERCGMWESFRLQKKKRGKRGGSMDQGISQEPKMISGLQKITPSLSDWSRRHSSAFTIINPISVIQ